MGDPDGAPGFCLWPESIWAVCAHLRNEPADTSASLSFYPPPSLLLCFPNIQILFKKKKSLGNPVLETFCETFLTKMVSSGECLNITFTWLIKSILALVRPFLNALVDCQDLEGEIFLFGFLFLSRFFAYCFVLIVLLPWTPPSHKPSYSFRFHVSFMNGVATFLHSYKNMVPEHCLLY